tara:strand:- start:290 stop:457 length:168 start_codon:yes stop_codon:yes gene_type:complete
MTLDQFKTTEFYKTMKQFYMITPFRGVVMNETKAEQVLKDSYWRLYFADNLEGIQ